VAAGAARRSTAAGDASPGDPVPLTEAAPNALDLIISGGRVIDPATGTDDQLDVGVAGGRIAVIAKGPLAATATTTIDARGCLVVPGLVDIHTHLLAGGSFWGIRPTPVAWRTGVTTWVDAGSAGVYNLPQFLELEAGYHPLTVYGFLNISGIGLVGQTGELALPEHCDPSLCAEALIAHRERLVGVKCRLDYRATAGGSPQALQLALAAARAAEVPVMVHIGQGPPSLSDVLAALRPGDIVTHCTTGQNMTLIDHSGAVRDCVREAQARGVLFDVGHGSGGFSFAVAEALIEDGLVPDVVSSDLHQLSVLGPGFDLPTTMSKLLAAGMGLTDVIAAATSRAALAIGRGDQCGTLARGRRADIAVLRQRADELRLFDSYLEDRRSANLLTCEATVAGGRVLPAEAAELPAPWVELSPAQQQLLSDRGTAGPSREPWAASLQDGGDFVPMPISGPPRVRDAP
jgi:dihydroorotase